jgi:transcriptional regulator with XRE-family HTH domain
LEAEFLAGLYSRIKEALKTEKPAEIARKLGIERQSVYKWRDGKNPPDLDRIIQIARVTNSSLHWLLTGIGPKTVAELKQAAGEAIEQPDEATIGRNAVRDYIIGQFNALAKDDDLHLPVRQAADEKELKRKRA